MIHPMEKPTTKTPACGGGGGGGGEDFMIEILVRLPLVSLLRFKSVCKSWRNLIQTSFFIDLHTTTTLTSSKQQLGGDTFILQASRVCGSEFIVFSCESAAGQESSEYINRFGTGGWYLGTDGNWFRSTDGDKKKKKKKSDDDEEVVVFKLDNLEHPQSSCYNFIRPTDMVGSCNGLICLHDTKLRDDVFLWNPATRQSRLLPKSSLTTIEVKEKRGKFNRYLAAADAIGSADDDDDNHLDDMVFCAFGFDVKTNDYKVLLITFFNTKYIGPPEQLMKYLCRVEVYSLSTNSWRRLEDINYLPGVPSQERSLYHPGVYLNGCYFFVGCKFSSESQSFENSLIISFDFSKEIFNTMQFPSDDDDDALHDYYDDYYDAVVQKRIRWYLSCLGDQLAVFAILDYNNADALQDYYDDYGNYEDWEDYNENYDYGYEDCDIWVLNEHGGGSSVIKESWTILHSFQIKKRGAREWIIPRGILNNGEFALLETTSTDGTKKKMQLYNLVTKEAKTDFLVCSWVKATEVYKPSLVSIIGGNGAAAPIE